MFKIIHSKYGPEMTNMLPCNENMCGNWSVEVE